jgi:hypothetical protein
MRFAVLSSVVLSSMLITPSFAGTFYLKGCALFGFAGGDPSFTVIAVRSSQNNDCNTQINSQPVNGEKGEDFPYEADAFSAFNVCGYSQLNLYDNGSGGYTVYQNNGNGQPLANCYQSSRADKYCVVSGGLAQSQCSQDYRE